MENDHINQHYAKLLGLGDEAIAHRNDLLKCALDTGKAWSLKELFGWFWKSRDKYWAKASFTFWHEQVMKSGLKHMIKVANTLKDHLYGLLFCANLRIHCVRPHSINPMSWCRHPKELGSPPPCWSTSKLSRLDCLSSVSYIPLSTPA